MRALVVVGSAVVVMAALLISGLSSGSDRASAAAHTVWITALSCDTNPEYVRIKKTSEARRSLSAGSTSKATQARITR